ncbi:MAG TPA: glycosyltransferase [Dongiaceae bacterium]|nr:glycosyltransferase [Dongiaceae bacterium]
MKLSFCVPCMNRFHHLEQTIGRTLRTLWHGGHEFELVILNYMGRDGLGAWIRAAGRTLIESGGITYFEVLEPSDQHYRFAHAKNVAHRLATGDVMCSLDADNVLTSAYLDELVRAFAPGGPVFLHTAFEHSAGGRIAFRRDDFFRLGGYDEDLTYCEDLDAHGRAVRFGLVPRAVAPSSVEFVRHTDDERVRFLRRTASPGTETLSATRRIRRLIVANKAQSARNIAEGRLVANAGRPWGTAIVRKNLSELIELR